jgi:hypothetical protein
MRNQTRRSGARAFCSLLPAFFRQLSRPGNFAGSVMRREDASGNMPDRAGNMPALPTNVYD